MLLDFNYMVVSIHHEDVLLSFFVFVFIIFALTLMISVCPHVCLRTWPCFLNVCMLHVMSVRPSVGACVHM